MLKVKSVKDLGPQFTNNNHKMVGQDGAYSIVTSKGLLFYFGDTIIGKRVSGESLWYPGGTAVGHRDMSGLGGTEKMLNNTGLLLTNKNIETGIKNFNYVLDNEGNIKQLIPLLEDEDPDWIRVWCLHGVEVWDKLYLFFIKVRTKDEGIFPVNFDVLGSGIAVGDTDNWEFTRVYHNGSDILWKAEQPHFAAAVLKEENNLYLFGVVQDKHGTQNCYLAKVGENKIEDLQSYEYYAGNNSWSKNINDAATVFTGMPNELSVSYNEYLKKYLAVHSLDLTGKIVARTADKPWGPWSEPVELFRVEVEREKELPYPVLIYAGKEHPYLSREKGKVLYVTYIEFEEYYPHLLEITLE
ncbi:MAG: DUF4185 domain-containing protein [Ignavibacteria bacterium]